jgi:hypothetical protein
MHIRKKSTWHLAWNLRRTFRRLDDYRNPDSLKSIRFIFLIVGKLSAISPRNQARPAMHGE